MNKLNLLPANPEEESRGRFPSWLHRKIPNSSEMFKTGEILREYGLNTVCEEAKCPNRSECYSKKTATFLALGKECTRNCGFCDIDFSKAPILPQEDEPQRIAFSVQKLGLKHVVITMVARDDLQDGGAAHIASIVKTVREQNPKTTIELLTSDFAGNFDALDTVLDTRPEIFNHNIETVRSLSPKIRHKAQYDRTLQVLKHARDSGKAIYVKSGIMLGLGESQDEVHETISDLYLAGCSIITLGQYLQPSKQKLRVKEFIPPEAFDAYAQFGRNLGVLHMYAGPFIRSSYNASLFAPLAK
jgi:lipoic acid synthetase